MLLLPLFFILIFAPSIIALARSSTRTGWVFVLGLMLVVFAVYIGPIASIAAWFGLLVWSFRAPVRD